MGCCRASPFFFFFFFFFLVILPPTMYPPFKNTITLSEAKQTWLEQKTCCINWLTKRQITVFIYLFPILLLTLFSFFLVTLSYASGCIWSHCTATRGHTPRPGWSSSQSVLKSALWSPGGFPYCVTCRWVLQKRPSALQKKKKGNRIVLGAECEMFSSVCYLVHLIHPLINVKYIRGMVINAALSLSQKRWYWYGMQNLL